MSTKQQKRRAVIQTALRTLTKDMENSIVGALDDPDLSDDDEGGGGRGDVHVHVGGAGAAPAAPVKAAGADEGAGEVTPERFAALEQSVASLAEAIKQLGGGGAPAAPAAGAPDEEPSQQDAMPEELEAAAKAKTGDSVALQTAFQAVVADAEVLIPGFKVPTFDAKASRKLTLDGMCQLRRSTLGHVSMTSDGAAMLDAFGKGLDLQKASCVDVARLFRSVASAKKLINNTAATRDGGTVPNLGAQVSEEGMTIAKLNALNAKAWQPTLAAQALVGQH